MTVSGEMTVFVTVEKLTLRAKWGALSEGAMKNELKNCVRIVCGILSDVISSITSNGGQIGLQMIDLKAALINKPSSLGTF